MNIAILDGVFSATKKQYRPSWCHIIAIAFAASLNSVAVILLALHLWRSDEYTTKNYDDITKMQRQIYRLEARVCEFETEVNKE